MNDGEFRVKAKVQSGANLPHQSLKSLTHKNYPSSHHQKKPTTLEVNMAAPLINLSEIWALHCQLPTVLIMTRGVSSCFPDLWLERCQLKCDVIQAWNSEWNTDSNPIYLFGHISKQPKKTLHFTFLLLPFTNSSSLRWCARHCVDTFTNCSLTNCC